MEVSRILSSFICMKHLVAAWELAALADASVAHVVPPQADTEGAPTTFRIIRAR